MLVRNVTDLELGLNSIERIEYYTKSIPQEKDYHHVLEEKYETERLALKGEIVIRKSGHSISSQVTSCVEECESFRETSFQDWSGGEDW